MIGISVCGSNILSIISNLNKVSQLTSAQRFVYPPLALGLILSFLVKMIEPMNAEKYRMSTLEGFAFAVFTTLVTAVSAHMVADRVSNAPSLEFQINVNGPNRLGCYCEGGVTFQSIETDSAPLRLYTAL